MATFITLKHVQTPELGMYAFIFDESGDVYNTGTTSFETFSLGSVSSYDLAATAIDSSGGTSSLWQIIFPVAITTVGTYFIKWFQQTVGSYPGTAGPVDGSNMEVRWDGSDIESIDQENNLSDVFHAHIGFMRSSSSGPEKYIAIWFKNGVALKGSQIFSPTIQVIRVNTGTQLLSESMGSLDIDGSDLGVFKHNEMSSLTTQGLPIIIIVKATIDGFERTWLKHAGLGYSQFSGGSYT